MFHQEANKSQEEQFLHQGGVKSGQLKLKSVPIVFT